MWNIYNIGADVCFGVGLIMKLIEYIILIEYTQVRNCSIFAFNPTLYVRVQRSDKEVSLGCVSGPHVQRRVTLPRKRVF